MTTTKWNEYQRIVADFFRSLGCNADVEKRVIGARGIHKIDVCVTFEVFGIKSTWLIECKYWRTPIPKEKVAAFGQIIQDVGADRGFLLSESGFQAGAIRMAEKMNVVLSSLDELRTSALPTMRDQGLRCLATAAHDLQNRLHDIYCITHDKPAAWLGADHSVLVDLLARVFAVKTLVLPKAQAGEFPMRLDLGGAVMGQNAEQVITIISSELQDVEKQLELLEARVTDHRVTLHSAIASLSEAVSHLIATGEMALFKVNISDPNFERLRNTALEAMISVGNAAEGVRAIATGHYSKNLHEVMKALIDGIYLDLSQSAVDIDQWNMSVTSARSALKSLDHQADRFQGR